MLCATLASSAVCMDRTQTSCQAVQSLVSCTGLLTQEQTVVLFACWMFLMLNQAVRIVTAGIERVRCLNGTPLINRSNYTEAMQLFSL